MNAFDIEHVKLLSALDRSLERTIVDRWVEL